MSFVRGPARCAPDEARARQAVQANAGRRIAMRGGWVGLALCAGMIAPGHAADSTAYAAGSAAGSASAAGGAPTVFRCEANGRITYSDQACPHAQKMHALRLPGVARVAAADSDTWRSYAVAGYGNGYRLGRSVDPECPHLAQRMGWVEAEEQRATADTIGLIQQRLAVQRSRFRELACDGGPMEGAG